MQFTGVTTFILPQVQNFSFCITGIYVPDANPVYFKFSDTGNNSFSFGFSGGYVSAEKIISTYNSIEPVSISGFVANNTLNYKINGIFGQTNSAFSRLNSVSVSGTTSKVRGDIFINSNPINYSLTFSSQYAAGGVLTGTVTTDTTFDLNNFSLFFYNSNANLFTGIIPTGRMYSGTNYLTFQDVDGSNFEYFNGFRALFGATFGNLGGNFSCYRGGIYSQNTITFYDYPSNIYSQTTQFTGYLSGGKFYYSDTPTNYNLNYSIQNLDYLGNPLPVSLTAKFQPLYPLNNSGYASAYVTGFTLTNSGLYSGVAPTVSFSKYYYVSGISQLMSNLLFSAGCGNQLPISFSGANTGMASGYLTLQDVYVSGFYGPGIQHFKAAFGYTPYSNGSGYLTPPVTIWGTGGACYSLPDFSGALYPFAPINGTRAVISSSVDYLTGVPLLSGLTGISGAITGYIVTGLKITNIGSGYSSTFPPTVTFSGSPLGNTASGVMLYKQTGQFNLTGTWSVSYNFLNSQSVSLSNYGSYYSGNISLPYNTNALNFNIACSNIDNTTPISGILTLGLGAYSTGSQTISLPINQCRTFSNFSGALN